MLAALVVFAVLVSEKPKMESKIRTSIICGTNAKKRNIFLNGAFTENVTYQGFLSHFDRCGDIPVICVLALISVLFRKNASEKGFV